MPELHQGMEPLPGFLDINSQVEHDFPGAEDIFRKFYGLKNAPQDIVADVVDARTEFPISAAIAVPNEYGRLKIVSFAKNLTSKSDGSLGHAEIHAIKGALKGGKHLPNGSVLLTSVEPCAMCAAGLVHSGGDTVLFGASQDDLRGQSSYVGRTFKPFRAEPEGYSAREFIRERNPRATVMGGFHRREIIDELIRF